MTGKPVHSRAGFRPAINADEAHGKVESDPVLDKQNYGSFLDAKTDGLLGVKALERVVSVTLVSRHRKSCRDCRA
jgi:hypothetical protein